MPVKIAINGYGRIGRNVLKALYEGNRRKQLSIVALNDLGDAKTNAHLTRYDTAHGPFPYKVEVDGSDLVVDGDRIRVCAERDPAKLPWGELGVDVVLLLGQSPLDDENARRPFPNIHGQTARSQPTVRDTASPVRQVLR
jgi:glyceraldehyde-3-phosphate dehydrogenase/erythrose-4-phosphate dehydrogenase